MSAMKKSLLILFVISMLGMTGGNPYAEMIRHGMIMTTKGRVEVKLKDSAWKPAEAGMTLYENDEVRTGKESTAKILIDENGNTGQLDLKPESQLRMGGLELDRVTGDKTTILDLAVGKVLVHAEKLKGNSRFQVRTPNSTTGVRGTTFLVDASAAKPSKNA